MEEKAKGISKVKLFKKSKSGMGYWEIYACKNVEGTADLVITYSKKLDGKPIIKKKVIKSGKNIGKNNETTPYTQALSEVSSRVNAQLDDGYKHSIQEIGPFHTNQLLQPIPQFAKRIEKIKNKDYSKFAHVQPKLDGHRCKTLRLKEGILQWSKGGKEITTMTHMHEELMDTLEVGEYLDGELYKHGMELQTISSLVKRLQEDSKLIEYHVYDSFVPEDLNMSYEDRFLNRFHTDDTSGLLIPIETHPVTCEEEAWGWFDYYVNKGYEGAMLRLGTGGYEVGERSSFLLKLKAEEDEEFEVKLITEAEPYIHIDGKTGIETKVRIARLHFETYEGSPFTATAPGKVKEKQEVLLNSEKYIGKKCTLKFANYTPDGIPFHPVAFRWREDL